ncbi:MAG: hypothetical protein RSF79_20955, partial [Janthinobacterium sp.]
MKRDDFLKQDDVRGFIDWLAAALPVKPFYLKMARSRFVPGGLDVRTTGLEAVLGHYVWSTRWTDAQGKAVVSANWQQTRASLNLLRGWLNDEGWEQACRYANACGALVVSRHGCA